MWLIKFWFIDLFNTRKSIDRNGGDIFQRLRSSVSRRLNIKQPFLLIKKARIVSTASELRVLDDIQQKLKVRFYSPDTHFF